MYTMFEKPTTLLFNMRSQTLVNGKRVKEVVVKTNFQKGVPHTLTMKQYNMLQIKHILKHKYYLSEKRKDEVSIEEAVQDWTMNGWAEIFRKTFRVIDHKGHTISSGF